MAAHPPRKQPAVSLVHQLATVRQHRFVLAVAVLQFLACLVISSFPASVPRIDGFIPTILAIAFVADLITAVLLFNQSSVIASRALLVLANGYLFSALIVIPHALTFPGAFAPKGLFGAGAQSSGWLNVFWNLGFIVAVAGYAWLKEKEYRNDAIPHSTLPAFCWSTATQIGFICALTWAVTAGDRFMPRMFLDDLNYTPLVHYAAGTIALLSVVTLLLMWIRLTSVLDLWVMVAICMLITEKMLVTLGMTARFSLGWYVSRALVVGVSTVVLIALLSELMRLHATLSRSQDLQRVLNAELDHRVKNVLATVSAVIAHTPKPRSTLADYTAALDERIRSLARTHELLSGTRADETPRENSKPRLNPAQSDQCVRVRLVRNIAYTLGSEKRTDEARAALDFGETLLDRHEAVPEFKHSRNVPLVAFVCFESGQITHLANARRGIRAATGMRA